MAIKKVLSGYEVRFRVSGRGSRSYRKTFPTKGECERFMRYTIAQHETQANDKPWLEKPKDSRILSELIETWDELHGHFLKDGKRRKAKMLMIAAIKGNKNRSVPISPELFEELHQHAKRTRGSRLFTSSISAFRRALKRTTIELPAGQASHVLRHTFASHFIMNGGNILTLQKILGHTDKK